MNMGGMSMGGGDMDTSGQCQISMLLNYYTIDACFISSSWHVRSVGAFAGSCIGIAALSASISLLRRLSRAFDAYLVGQNAWPESATIASRMPGSISQTAVQKGPDAKTDAANSSSSSLDRNSGSYPAGVARPVGRRPTVYQQMLRALLHMAQFVVAYFVMLVAMYYNVYMLVSLFLGAGLGFMIFEWDLCSGDRTDASQTTGCCG